MSREKAQVVVQEALREDALVRAQEDPMAWVWIAFFTVAVAYTVALLGLTRIKHTPANTRRLSTFTYALHIVATVAFAIVLFLVYKVKWHR